MEQDTNNIPELQSPFEQLREVDADGKEWWNSRKLARVMGYRLSCEWNGLHHANGDLQIQLQIYIL